MYLMMDKITCVHTSCICVNGDPCFFLFLFPFFFFLFFSYGLCGGVYYFILFFAVACVGGAKEYIYLLAAAVYTCIISEQ